MARMFFTEETFDYSNGNPFNDDRKFNKSWVAIKIVEDKDNQIVSGNLHEGLYVILLSKSFSGWQIRLMDFIEYYQSNESKNVIIASKKEDYEEAKKAYQGHCHLDRKLRSYEPKILVHSTTTELWDKIKACGKLKSWKKAKEEGVLQEREPIGRQLNDPDEFSHYVMVGDTGVMSEIVVLSKQLGELCYDMHAKYSPGARIYLDAKKIAADGLLVRDGIHLKIKDELVLEDYVIDVITIDKLVEPRDGWTPLSFSTSADKYITEK